MAVTSSMCLVSRSTTRPSSQILISRICFTGIGHGSDLQYVFGFPFYNETFQSDPNF